MKTKIIMVPTPILRQPSKAVEFDKKTLELVASLKETLAGKKGEISGVGLAAIQIGIPKRVFVAYSPASKKLLTFINPEIIWFSKRQTNGIPGKNKYEGCLSLPNRWAVISRAKDIKVKYQTESGQTLVRKFSGVLATIVQHEYDHLDGILFIDRALEQGAKIYELVEDKEGEEHFEEINL